jgi:acid phosphatase family membrane protein YuiD
VNFRSKLIDETGLNAMERESRIDTNQVKEREKANMKKVLDGIIVGITLKERRY